LALPVQFTANGGTTRSRGRRGEKGERVRREEGRREGRRAEKGEVERKEVEIRERGEGRGRREEGRTKKG
jgi:hypothetical protein